MERYVLFLLLLLPFAGAFVSYLTGKKEEKGRILTTELTVILEFVGFFLLTLTFFALRAGGFRQMHAACPGFGLGLHLCLDGFRCLYCLITAFLWLIATLFMREYFEGGKHQNRFSFFWLVTLGATVGVFLSADLYTVFLFFEVMSFTSYVWVAHDETKAALRAGSTYLAVAVIGGLVMLMGLFLLYDMFGTLNISELSRRVVLLRAANALPLSVSDGCAVSRTRLYLAGGCLLFGFGAKAGAFPLHIWLPRAYQASPAPASALLSGVLSKAGLFGVIAVTSSLLLYDRGWGNFLLLIGIATLLLGAVLALFSVDLKRTLACSSISQIGFILVGIGMMVLLGTKNGIAARGTLLHMVNHSLFKLTLFLAAGAVFEKTHRLNLNELRGFGRKNPFFQAVFLTGALGICGIPPFSGYISKTLLHEAIAESQAGAVEWIFLIGGGFTVAYMLKLYVALCVEKNPDAQRQKEYDEMGTHFLTRKSRAALAASALPILLLGLFPHLIMDRLAMFGEGFLGSSGVEEQIFYYSFANLEGILISVGIGLFLYFGVVRTLLMKKEGERRVYADRWPAWLDLEELLYRPVLCTLLPLIAGSAARVLDRLTDGIIVLLRRTVYRDSPIPHERSEGNWLTDTLGTAVDDAGKIFHRKTDYKHRFAVLYENLSESGMIIGRSLSFGLFMACIGLILTLLYLLIS